MALGLELLIHLRAKAVHQHNAHAHRLDQRQVLRNVVGQGGEENLAVHARLTRLQCHRAHSCRHWFIQIPMASVGKAFARRTMGGGQHTHLEPGVIGKHLNEALTDGAGGAEDTHTDLAGLARQIFRNTR